MARMFGRTLTNAELWNGVPHFLPREWGDLKWLESQPVLREGQSADLIVDEAFELDPHHVTELARGHTGICVRVWLARTDVADGEPFDHTVTVEVRTDTLSWHDRWCFPAL